MKCVILVVQEYYFNLPIFITKAKYWSVYVFKYATLFNVINLNSNNGGSYTHFLLAKHIART